MSAYNKVDVHNVGIINFFEKKTLFITGSTGFIGKVFVEKLLRAVPVVEKMYLLVRANNEEALLQRVKAEIIDSKLFKVLRENYGDTYDEFMWKKLVPIAGDICKPYLGIDIDLVDAIKNDVNVIVHIGGNSSKWHDRHDKSLEANVSAVSRVVDFALSCTKLDLFMHVSSGYVNSTTIPMYEKLIDLGRHHSKDVSNLELLSVEQLVEYEMRLTSEVAQRFNKEDQAMEMFKLGMRRSKFLEFPSNYLLTKSMGELIAYKPSGKFPVVIIRPTLVESTFKEPFPGWIEGYKVLDPIILCYGTGELKGIPANPSTTIDVVPVDMVVNAMIAAIAKHGNGGMNGVKIYNVASSHLNPLSCHDFFNFSTEFFTKHPFKDTNGNVIEVENIKYFDSLIEFVLAGLNDKFQGKILRIAAVYEQLLTTAGAWLDDKNTRKLLGEMSLEESNMFNFDVKCIDWKNYFINTHIPGLARHLVQKNTLSAKL